MNALSVIYALLFYFAVAVLLIFTIKRIALYARTPAPLKIPTTPAPTTTTGVVLRMTREVVFFESLFKATKWTWLFGWMFHLALLLAFFRHLRYAMDPVIWPLGTELVQAAGKYAGFMMLAGLAGLFARRVFVDRVRYISAPSDYLMLILLFAIAGSGLMMTYVVHTDVIALQNFVIGLFTFSWQPLPADALLIVHLSLVLILALIFPFSKLLHAPCIFFSPTRNQVDNPRERRHLAQWARKLEEAGQ